MICYCLILCDRVAVFFFFFKQKTAYEMRISDWSSDVCSSDLIQLIIVVAVPTFVGEAAAFVSAELSATAALNELDDLNARESEREAWDFRGDHFAIDALFYGHDVVAEVALDEALRPCADLQRLELLLGNRLSGNVSDDRGVLGLGPEHQQIGRAHV